MRKLVAGFMVCLFWTFQAQAAEPIIIPVVTDPSPVIDGNLQEWANRGVLVEWKKAEQVTFGRESWKGSEDLSGWARIGYDNQHLYVAAHVVDSFLLQNQSGRELYRGDHILALLDFIGSGKKMDIIACGISPGNLKAPGDAGPDVRPEFIIWRPAGASALGARVAARRTGVGYDIEAAVPWKLLKVKPARFQTFAMELTLSDCDQSPLRQETIYSINTTKWTPWDPKRLVPAGLADRKGYLPPDAFRKAMILVKDLRITKGQTKEFVVNMDKIPEGLIPTLTFKARIHSPRTGGCSGPLRTLINGKTITQDNIANRPRHMTALNGVKLSAWYAAGVRMWFGPSFEAIEQSPYKPLDVVSYSYILRLDRNKMIRAGRNTITFRYEDQRPNLEIVLADVAFSWQPPSRFTPPKVWKPAPTGPLSTIEPWGEHKVDYKVTALTGGALKVSWAGRELVFESRFSRPGGGWAELKAKDSPGWNKMTEALWSREGPNERFVCSGRTDALQLIRTYIPYDECILVRDTLTNTSGDTDRPVIIAHRTAPGPYEALYLTGRPMPMKTGASAVPANPSVVVIGKTSGFGMVAHDDVFRIHSRVSCDAKFTEIGDSSLVLRPGVTYRHEWLIVPLPRPDYWHFVNAARRYFKTNFTIPGSFCFFSLHKKWLNLFPWEIKTYLDRKNARLASVGLMARYKGLHPHGPTRLTLDPTKAIMTNRTITAVRPRTKLLSYFNCFDYARRPEDTVLFKECRVMGADGKEIRGEKSVYPLYYPTLTNRYGKEMDKIVDWLLNTVGAEGLYWDCYAYKLSHYDEPWDGWSGDIDPRNHKLRRKKSSLVLISWPWRERLTARLLKEGRPIVANGNPSLTSEYKYRFPRFVETADITRLSKTHLFTPIALGDHITERNEVDSYRWMLRALDWGGLYYWYSGRIIPTHHTLTTYMFPVTPLELHSGYIIAEERILTNRSGLFGWGDMAAFEAHVFDRVGKETDKIKVPRVVKDGKAYAEVRIPEGYSVAIVRK